MTAISAVAYNRLEKIFMERQYEMANQVGKRYHCAKCDSEFIVTRGGEGTIVCCGQPMELKK